MKRLIQISLSVLTLVAAGCSTPTKTTPVVATPATPASHPAGSTAFEGAWNGRETTGGHEGTASMSISGQNMEFHGSGGDDWLKATFTLKEDTHPKQFVGVLTDCANQDYIGKTCYAIYKLENGTLTIVGNEPGVAEVPAGFDAPGTRQFVFKHD